MENTTQIRFGSHLLPSLGALVPGSKNELSPLGLHFDREPAPDEIAETGLVDPQGKLHPEYQQVLAELANPSSLVDLRFAAGEHLQQFSLYFGQNDRAPILLMNTTEGLLLEYPADTEAILDGLMQFSSDSMIVSFDLDITLPHGSALALAALVDLHRREAARAFADLSPEGTFSIHVSAIEDWIAHCPEDPQWLTILMRRGDLGTSSPRYIEDDLNDLVKNGLCQVADGGYALAGEAQALGNRMVFIDHLYFVDIARIDDAGQVGLASMLALQAGIHDLLQIDFVGDQISFNSLSPIIFILRIQEFLEKGGQILPDLPVPAAAAPIEGSEATPVRGLIVPGKEDVFLLKDTTVIGRSEICDLCLDDQQASRQHARIERRQDSFWIVDLGSSNGVFVNEQRISEAVQLRFQDQIRIGNTILKVEGSFSASSEAATIIAMKPTSVQAPSQPADEAPPPVDAALVCQQCQQPLKPDAMFCGSCGTPVNQPPFTQAPPQPAANICQQCGHTLSATARFCAKCGATVER